MRLGVLASGAGTILGALAGAGLDIAVVVVDRACAATAVAEDAGLPVVVITRPTFGPDFDRASYSKQIALTLEEHGVELLCNEVLPRLRVS